MATISFITFTSEAAAVAYQAAVDTAFGLPNGPTLHYDVPRSNGDIADPADTWRHRSDFVWPIEGTGHGQTAVEMVAAPEGTGALSFDPAAEADPWDGGGP